MSKTLTRFDEVTRSLGHVKFMTERQALVLRSLIEETEAQDILEIGFYRGKSSAYIGAILEDRGKGSLLTIDRRSGAARKPGIADLLRRMSLEHRVTPVFAHRSFTWELQKLIADGAGARFDFCYFDGGHTWDDTGFGFLLVHLLLRPGGVILFDDMNWTIEHSSSYSKKKELLETFSPDERTAPTVRRVWDLILPTLGYTDQREITDLGWAMARKPC